jgi:cytochrome c oxidase subunit 2
LVPAVAILCGADAPLGYLTAHGNKAGTVLPLTWFVTWVSVAVIVIISVLVAAGIARGARFLPRRAIADLPVGHTASGLSWIVIGVAITSVVLLATVVWTMWVLADVSKPPGKPPLTIRIVAHQWWWEADYLDKRASQDFTTANEIHIPTGVPVMFDLQSADVIHSFWVPPLNGKTDTIPGRTNVTWMDARNPGIYRGQCTEYCGWQHAHMGLLLIAQSPAQFAAWRKHQLQDQPPPHPGAQTAAAATFTTQCGSCHTVRGSEAGGVLGPDLSHLMSRTTIAAGTLRNSTGNLSAWIADPQSIKPGCLMPRLELSGPQLAQVRTYLETLK